MSNLSEFGIIKLAIVPALATPGKFIVASEKTGNVMSINGKFDGERMKYFDSETAAREFVEAIPPGLRKYSIVN